MRTLAVFGTSHARRLASNLKEIKIVKDNFQLIEKTYPGKTFAQIRFPRELYDLTEQDILIVQLFGNDAMSRKNIVFTQNPRKIVCTKFETETLNEMNRIFLNAKVMFAKVKARVLFLDLIHRHLEFPQSKPYWDLLNKQIRICFSKLENFLVIDHRQLLNWPRKLYKNKVRYSALLADNVHFKPHVYLTISKEIVSRYIAPNVPGCTPALGH